MANECSGGPDWVHRLIAAFTLIVIATGFIWGPEGAAALLLFLVISLMGALGLVFCVGLALFALLGGKGLEKMLERAGYVPILGTMALGSVISVLYAYS